MAIAALATAAILPRSAPATIDPTRLQQFVDTAHRLADARRGQPIRWQVDPGNRACLLRDADPAASRLMFIRETGRISLWLAPRPQDLPAGSDERRAYQLYIIPLDDNPKTLVANEFGATMWREPLSQTADPGLAVQLDPAGLAARYPAGAAVILAQGDRTLFGDIFRPDIAPVLIDFLKCRGGR
jgi:hypothetical protein